MYEIGSSLVLFVTSLRDAFDVLTFFSPSASSLWITLLHLKWPHATQLTKQTRNWPSIAVLCAQHSFNRESCKKHFLPCTDIILWEHPKELYIYLNKVRKSLSMNLICPERTYSATSWPAVCERVLISGGIYIRSSG